MKRYRSFTLFLFLCLMPGYYAAAQIFKGEIIGGFNKSQVDGDEAYGFKKYGLTGAVGITAPIYKNWSLSLETGYSQKGSRQKPQFADSLDGSYRLNLNYVEVPFMIQYTDRDLVSAGLGVSWNRLVGVNEWRNGFHIDSVTMQSKVFSPNDFQGFGDLRIRVYRNIIFNARYSYSLKKIATRTVIDSETGKPNERNFYNNLWTFRIIYMINEKRSDKLSKPKNINQVE